MNIIDPRTKKLPELDKKYIKRIEQQLNRATSYPININIGNHIINSYTQDYIERMVRDCGFYEVSRQMESKGRYEVLRLDFHYSPSVKPITAINTGGYSV